jgi:transcriptional regulator of acetoin/glycerol metabolism
MHIPDTGPARRSAARHRPPIALPGLVGRSKSWVDVCIHVREAARARVPTLIVGEPGVGKLALARGAHQDRDPTASILVVDCENDLPEQLHGLLAAGYTQASTVVFRHLERLDPSGTAETADLLAEFAQQPTGPWVVGTASVGLGIPDPMLRPFRAAVTVPPLRHRADDLHELVPALLNRLAPGRHATCTADAIRVLERNVWPGNVAELLEVLRNALIRRPVGPIRLEDLPPACFTTSRRALTPIEALERDAIIRALADADGNRKRAAENLGMSRSSLYRKIHVFGLT